MTNEEIQVKAASILAAAKIPIAEFKAGLQSEPRNDLADALGNLQKVVKMNMEALDVKTACAVRMAVADKSGQANELGLGGFYISVSQIDKSRGITYFSMVVEAVDQVIGEKSAGEIVGGTVKGDVLLRLISKFPLVADWLGIQEKVPGETGKSVDAGPPRENSK